MEMRSNSISWSTLANWACSGCAVIQVGGLELARIKAVGGGVEVAGLAAAAAGEVGRGVGHGQGPFLDGGEEDRTIVHLLV